MMAWNALEGFWRELAVAAHSALLLDYDGTLAPFCVDRDRALPYPGVRERLTTLQEDTDSRLVIISGRAVDDLIPLLGIMPLPELWGCHGWERRLPSGEQRLLELPAAARRDLDQAFELLQQTRHGTALERKPASLALHWRGLEPAFRQDLEARAKSLWEPLLKRGVLQLHSFDGGLELRCTGRDKGTVVEDILRQLEPTTAVAFLGDDLTDEDGFSTLGDRGLSVLVRDTPRRTAAHTVLRPPEELLEFLDHWIDLRRPRGVI